MAWGCRKSHRHRGLLKAPVCIAMALLARPTNAAFGVLQNLGDLIDERALEAVRAGSWGLVLQARRDAQRSIEQVEATTRSVTTDLRSFLAKASRVENCLKRGEYCVRSGVPGRAERADYCAGNPPPRNETAMTLGWSLHFHAFTKGTSHVPSQPFQAATSTVTRRVQHQQELGSRFGPHSTRHVECALYLHTLKACASIPRRGSTRLRN